MYSRYSGRQSQVQLRLGRGTGRLTVVSFVHTKYPPTANAF
ncbi:hypothetical protein CGLO_03129 [Colletotrichum gloeosporioides Cg-14]|uniref:Uncharacterized protein n=1 Tax=Colletotrichum gloeosporioides (strain Cg-14) TaxID=1237896 RepID=T0KWB6_COLGC|nr:hypothetical protein CGLO_03129 [Colletotrichum gloeosporioides Cg-14]